MGIVKARISGLMLEFEGITKEDQMFSDAGAVMSPDARYRYVLWRHWAGQPIRTIAFVGLNPSTADATKDDPTIRKCIGFAKRLGFGRLVMLNLFAARATDPAELDSFDDAVGPDNAHHVACEVDRATIVVAAWGAHRFPRRQSSPIGSLLERKAIDLWCLGTTKDGCPKHPLYVPYSAQLQRWNP